MQISTKTVIRPIQTGRLRASRLGKRGAFRSRLEDFETWIAESAFERPGGRQIALAATAALYQPRMRARLRRQRWARVPERVRSEIARLAHARRPQPHDALVA